MHKNIIKNLVLTAVFSMAVTAYAEQIAPIGSIKPSQTFPGQSCWQVAGHEERPNADGLVCRDGKFRQITETNRWEEYRNVTHESAKRLMQASSKDGAICHELKAERMVVCYWR